MKTNSNIMDSSTDTSSKLVHTTFNWEGVYPDFGFDRHTLVGEFNNYGTSEYPIAVCLRDLVNPVSPFIFLSNIKFCNPNFVSNQEEKVEGGENFEKVSSKEEFIYPEENYNSVGIRKRGKVFIPKDRAHRMLGEWWLKNVWPTVKDVPGVTKYTAFFRFNNIEMDKYITGWSEDWVYFTRDICDIMDFRLN